MQDAAIRLDRIGNGDADLPGNGAEVGDYFGGRVVHQGDFEQVIDVGVEIIHVLWRPSFRWLEDDI